MVHLSAYFGVQNELRAFFMVEPRPSIIQPNLINLPPRNFPTFRQKINFILSASSDQF